MHDIKHTAHACTDLSWVIFLPSFIVYALHYFGTYL